MTETHKKKNGEIKVLKYVNFLIVNRVSFLLFNFFFFFFFYRSEQKKNREEEKKTFNSLLSFFSTLILFFSYSSKNIDELR